MKEAFQQTPALMEVAIKAKISELESEHGIKVIFAVESGSRMWNFHSANSDYDVRFIYFPAVSAADFYGSYKRIGYPYKDSLNYMSDDRILDFSGWDLCKTFRHIAASNISVIEWCNSPICYHMIKGCEGLESLRSNMALFFAKHSDIGHVYSQAKGIANSAIKEALSPASAKLKRAMYCARMLMLMKLLSINKCLPKSFSWDDLIAECKDKKAFDEKHLEIWERYRLIKMNSECEKLALNTEQLEEISFMSELMEQANGVKFEEPSLETKKAAESALELIWNQTFKQVCHFDESISKFSELQI